MQDQTIESAFVQLQSWCRKRDFAGYDPFDALNSRLFQKLPFKYSPIARLAWTQGLKRSPINLRRLALIPAEKNPKGIALFALASLATYRRTKAIEAEMDARDLLDELIQLRSSGFNAWGYNFPWQSRKFFAARGTPMIVPTAFAARAFLEAYLAFGDDEHLQTARGVCEFITKHLQRTVDTPEELCFGYSLFDQTRIFNASLLAVETLATVSAASQSLDYVDLIARAVRYVLRRQKSDGSWVYGAETGQSWVDSFHTAYVLQSLMRIANACPQLEVEIRGPLQSGYEFWRDSFFLADGWPKYYHDSLYPADAHAAATAIITLLELRTLDSKSPQLAQKIAAWTIRNLRDRDGYFYYQKRRFFTVTTPYMRWTQAWMLYALARLLEEKVTN